MIEKLGVDIGGVIIDRVNDKTDTSFFSDNFLQTKPVPGVFEALRALSEVKYTDQIFLVSKCGERIQKRTLAWLDHHDFYKITGIQPNQVHFCLERPEKAGICERLGITHFVDDRLEILSSMQSMKTRYLFQSRAEEIKKYVHFLDQVKQVSTWQEILENELH